MGAVRQGWQVRAMLGWGKARNSLSLHLQQSTTLPPRMPPLPFEVTEEIQKLCGVNVTVLAIIKESYIEMMRVFKGDPLEAKQKFN